MPCGTLTDAGPCILALGHTGWCEGEIKQDWAAMHEALRPYWMQQESMTAAEAIRRLVALAASPSTGGGVDWKRIALEAIAKNRDRVAAPSSSSGEGLPTHGTRVGQCPLPPGHRGECKAILESRTQDARVYDVGGTGR